MPRRKGKFLGRAFSKMPSWFFGCTLCLLTPLVAQCPQIGRGPSVSTSSQSACTRWPVIPARFPGALRIKGATNFIARAGS